jgi:hypothetical protein
MTSGLSITHRCKRCGLAITIAPLLKKTTRPLFVGSDQYCTDSLSSRVQHPFMSIVPWYFHKVDQCARLAKRATDPCKRNGYKEEQKL